MTLTNSSWHVAIKTGVAALLSMWVGYGLGRALNHENTLMDVLWTTVSAILVMQAHLGGTYQAALARLIGTLLGGVLSLVVLYTLGDSSPVVAISVALTVLLCSRTGLTDSIRIATITVAVVLLLWRLHPDMAPWQFALLRLIDAALGILVAVVVSHTLWPAHAARKTLSLMTSIWQEMRQHFVALCSQENPLLERQQLWLVEKKLEEVSSFFNEAHYELRQQLPLDTLARSIEITHSMYDTLIALQETKKAAHGPPFLTGKDYPFKPLAEGAASLLEVLAGMELDTEELERRSMALQALYDSKITIPILENSSAEPEALVLFAFWVRRFSAKVLKLAKQHLVQP